MAPGLDADKPVGGNEPKDIHQPIPANLQGAEREKHRIDMWIGKHDELAEPLSFEMHLQHRERSRRDAGNTRGLSQGARLHLGQFFHHFVGEPG